MEVAAKRMDDTTARKFSESWNNLPVGSVYTEAQFEEWMSPLTRNDIEKKRVLEMGCGNGSLMVHMNAWRPSFLQGVDLGDSVLAAYKNMALINAKHYEIVQTDLTTLATKGFDVVYCIGVLHHLKDPYKGFTSVVRNVLPKGKFHCWVYGNEGNGLIRLIVEPLRKIACKLPWFITKFCIALPAVIPYFVYAKTIALIRNNPLVKKLPLYDYSIWIAQREFAFFHHVAFDQLVTPQTTYLSRETIEKWLGSIALIDPKSVYIIQRNGNSWKFGGRVY